MPVCLVLRVAFGEDRFKRSSVFARVFCALDLIGMPMLLGGDHTHTHTHTHTSPAFLPHAQHQRRTRPRPFCKQRRCVRRDPIRVAVYLIASNTSLPLFPPLLHVASKPQVTKELYYIIVETPEGNFGRDIDGFFKE